VTKYEVKNIGIYIIKWKTLQIFSLGGGLIMGFCGGKSSRIIYSILHKTSAPENFNSLLYSSFPFISLKYTHL
jgi:hypothetical protein